MDVIEEKPISAHQERVRGIARQHGISEGIADEVAKETAPAETLPGSAKDHLRAFVERIERMVEEMATLSEDMKSVYAEAKSSGFDTKTIRKIIRLRKMDDHQRMEAEALLATYMHAVGMPVQTNMGF